MSTNAGFAHTPRRDPEMEKAQMLSPKSRDAMHTGCPRKEIRDERWMQNGRPPSERRTIRRLRGGPPMLANREIRGVARCQARNRRGKPCAAPPVRDAEYCSLHLHPE